MTFLNILCYLGSCIVSIFQKSKDDQSQIQPTSFGGEALEGVPVDHDGLLTPENPAGPAPLDMILVDGPNCANQHCTTPATIEEGEAMKDVSPDRPRDPKDSATLNTIVPSPPEPSRSLSLDVDGGNKKPSQPSITTTDITVIIDEVLFNPQWIKENTKECPPSESMTKMFPSSVVIAVPELTFKSFVDSLRSRMLLLFLQIEQDIPAHWLRDELPEKRINSIKDLADVVLTATRKTIWKRSYEALSCYGIEEADLRDCGDALFHSRPEWKAKEWIVVSFTVQDKPDMAIFLQKDGNDAIAFDVSAKMTLGDVRQTANLRSGRFSFSDQEYTEKDDNAALSDLGVSAQSLLGFISWLEVTVQIDAFYFYPSRMTKDTYHLSIGRAQDVYWVSTVPWMDFWKLPITVEINGPGSTFQSFTDLLRSHILNNMMHELPTEWRRDEFRADKYEDVLLSVTRGTESSTVWALKKHGIGMNLEGEEGTRRCGNSIFESRADDRKEYAHVVFSVKDI